MSVSLALDGKVAIVTGGSRGIGEAIARAFVQAGAKVVIAARKAEGVQAVALSINEKSPGSAHAIAAHTGKEEDCKRLVAGAVAHFGKVDVLVNNAGTNPHFGPTIDIEMPAWDKTFEVNLKGYFWMMREVALHLRGREAPGSIVNMASVAGLRGTPLQGVYAATKAAVISLTKTLAFELGGNGIRVNAIAPGFVDTRLAAAIMQSSELVAKINDRTGLHRHAQPEEIAGSAVFLASDASAYVTGHTLVVDGGLTQSLV
jgi:NAD(P)-dependent dehydrogenase (short-subunit alcohol dehydrogenase family)